MKINGLRLQLGAGAVLGAVILLFSDSALSQTSFFQGKTIVVVQGRDPGGTGDLRVKALFPFLQKYIPGNPTIVSEYMPGGGSRKAANQIFRTSRPDGLTIGNFSSAMVSLAVLGESGVLYDIDKFHYLGSPYSTYHAVFVSRKEAGFNSIDKLRAATGIKIGAQSLGFSTYNEGRLFA
jgi:tripartite-type tricarboxylate transporter receptor subunit TctC